MICGRGWTATGIGTCTGTGTGTGSGTVIVLTGGVRRRHDGTGGMKTGGPGMLAEGVLLRMCEVLEDWARGDDKRDGAPGVCWVGQASKQTSSLVLPRDSDHFLLARPLRG